jgi:prophage regulatory protein
MKDGYLRVNAVAEYLDMGVSTIWAWSDEQKEGFPKPRKISPRVTLWKISDLDSWVNRNNVDEVTE